MPGRQVLTVTGQGELRRLARDLRRAGGRQAINAELRRELLIVGRKGAAAVRASVRATSSQGQSGRAGRASLRGKIARATEATVRSTGTRPGVKVWVNPGRMPDRERLLPAYYEGDISPWRHPTFGRRSRGQWATQRPHPYFWSALDSIAGDLSDAGDRVLNRIANKVERG
jgi:hypothetical protein